MDILKRIDGVLNEGIDKKIKEIWGAIAFEDGTEIGLDGTKTDEGENVFDVLKKSFGKKVKNFGDDPQYDNWHIVYTDGTDKTISTHNRISAFWAHLKGKI